MSVRIQIVLGRILALGNPVQGISKLIAKQQRHVAERLQISGAIHLVVDLVYDREAITVDFDCAIAEDLRI